ncbi:unnamed protein product [Microthlaspi erraticum]|uniref:Protein kinase domain-containing protein n=1 Tax=Microthlaspi erraticum TaxID=1685480 RepID=A0A6D2J090_9BRAS|nr:unnamed protein product [Microthlaspi erraticum]
MTEPLYVDESSLKDVRVLGRGTYGSVSLKVHPDNCRFYAKKTSSVQLKEHLEKELRIMLRLRNHPRIVQASSPHLHLGTTEPQDCYIYMEYASEGTLRKTISSFRGKSLPEYMIQRLVRMILQGLDALHSQGYVHCDLKPENVLLFPSTNPGEPWDVKLADFGLSKEPNTDPSHLCGTPQYMSPESSGPNRMIDPALDIYSLGCVVYEMFGAKPYLEIYEDYYEWNLFQPISPAAKDFLIRCHARHPVHRAEAERFNYPLRATAAELLKHPFVTQKLSVPLPPTSQQEDWRQGTKTSSVTKAAV